MDARDVMERWGSANPGIVKDDVIQAADIAINMPDTSPYLIAQLGEWLDGQDRAAALLAFSLYAAGFIRGYTVAQEDS